MIESVVDNDMILDSEPMLQDYYRTGQTTFNDIKGEALRLMTQDIISMNFEVRQLSPRLSLQTSVTKTDVFEGAQSDRDYAQRVRIVVPVTALTGNVTFTIEGSNTENGADSTYTTITTLTSSDDDTVETLTTTISLLFKYYRVSIAFNSGTTCTYSAYMIEECYTLLHLYLTRSKCFYQLYHVGTEEMYLAKAEYYEAKYEKMLSDYRFNFDSDDDEEISSSEAEDDDREITFGV